MICIGLLTIRGLTLLIQEILLILCLSVQLLVSVLLGQHVLVVAERKVLRLNWLVLRSIHVDIVQVRTPSPRQDGISIHLKGGNRVFRLVDRVHHVLVDGSVDEDVRSLILLLHRETVVIWMWVLIQIEVLGVRLVGRDLLLGGCTVL